MRLICFSLLGAVFLGLVGCATAPTQAPVTMTGNMLVDGPNAVANGPERDRVLWAYRTSAAAMRRGNYEIAKQMLDDALLMLGGIHGDKSAKQARGYFRGESRKTFRGEPYERVMAYIYRGILYWMDGEPDNARACFRSAQLQDADTETNEYRSDYALLDYWDGVATSRLAGDGSDAFKRAEQAARINKPGPYNPEHNTFVFIEFGPGPIKYATGQYAEQLRFRSNPSRPQFAVLRVNGERVKVGAVDDLDFQATTRGGRVMDHVLANKAVFKSGTDTFGDAAIISGAVLAGTQHGRGNAGDEIGAGLLVAGILSKVVSAATTPAADIRAWNNLPRYLSFASLRLPPGEHQLTVEFQDASGSPLPTVTKELTVKVSPDQKDKIVFVSDQSSTPQTL